MINIFIVINNHSGARTYAKELTSSLISVEGICLYHIFLESTSHYQFEIVKKNGVQEVHIPAVKLSSNFIEKYSRRCIDLLSNLLEVKDNLIFHLNYPPHLAIGLEARRRYGAKIVYTLHFLPSYFSTLNFDCLSTESLSTSLNQEEREILIEADRVICISKFARKVICEYYKLDPIKTRLIYNGVGGRSKFQQNMDSSFQSLGFKKSDRLVLFVGRLSNEKGLHALINAFTRISTEITNLRLVLAGNGDFNALLKLCSNIIGKVTVTGNLDRFQLQRLYKSAEIGIVPSRFELLGYSPIEMMANGLPIIISNVPGMNELVEEGVSGLVCEVTRNRNGSGLEINEQSLYSKMKLLLKNRMLRENISKNGWRTWKNYYTAQHMAENTLALYKEIFF